MGNKHIYLEERDWNSDKILVSTSLLDDSDEKLAFRNRSIHENSWESFILVRNFIRNVFLPTGFPASVPSEYRTFQTWNIIQDACSSLRGMMSTRALLEGMGVGRADVSAIQATVLWILRDGSSMVGSLLFTSFSSAQFGQNVKSWRLFADTVNNIGITLDMLAPLFRKHFLILVCLGSIFKALCGVAAGASGAVISEHWGRKNGNIADVMAKNGAQHTAIGLLGVAVSVWFASFANTTPTRIWTLYSALTALHMISNYQAMRILALRSLNHVRLDILVRRFLAVTTTVIASESTPDRVQVSTNMTGIDEALARTTLQEIARVEPIITPIIPFWRFFSPTYSLQNVNPLSETDWKDFSAKTRTVLSNPSYRLYNMKFWTPPTSLFDKFSMSDVKDALSNYQSKKYVILKDKKQYTNNQLLKRDNEVYVSFERDCTPKDQVMAYLEVYLRRYYGQLKEKNSRFECDIDKLLEELFPILWQVLEENDWDLTRIHIAPADATVYAVRR